MKKLLFLFAFLFVGFFSFGQTFQWAKQMSFNASENFENKVRDITTDANGNSFVVGQYSDTISAIGFNNQLISEGNISVFIAKYDPNGNLIWLSNITGSGTALVSGIVLNDQGNLVIAGSFFGSIDFNPGLGIDSSLTSEKGAYILQCDTSGSLNWVKRFVAQATASCRIDKIFKSNNSYIVTGLMLGTIDYNPGGLPNNVSTSTSDYFFLKLNNLGGIVWAKTFDGYIRTTDMATDTHGDIYYTGYFSNYCDFDPGIGVSGLSNYGTPNRDDIFISKLDANGNFLWVARQGGLYNEAAWSITIDTNENIYTTGSFSHVVDFDPGPNNVNMSSGSNNNNDLFLSSLDSNGSYRWAKKISSPNGDFGVCLKINSANELVLLGGYGANIDTDPNNGHFFLQSISSSSIASSPFISKFDLTGKLKISYPIQTIDRTYGTTFSLDANNNIYYIGGSYDSTDFDPTSGEHWLTKQSSNPSQTDIFISKLENCTSSSYEIIDTCDKYSLSLNGINYTYSASHSYLFTNSQNCDSVVTYDVTIGVIDTSIVLNGTMITASLNNATYQWLKCNPYAIIPGATNQTYTAPSGGDYAVVVSQNGCSDTSACVMVQSVGMDNISLNGISVYPNPSTGTFVISSTNNLKTASLKVMNSLGQVVYQKNNLRGSEFEINLANQAAGFYTLEIREEDKMSRLKLLKQ